MLLPLTGVLVLIFSTTTIGSWRSYGSGAVLGSYIALTHLTLPIRLSDAMAFDTMVAALASAADPDDRFLEAAAIPAARSPVTAD